MKYTLKYNENDSLKDAVKALDEGGVGFLALVDGNDKLIGIITDGDIRRAILNQETKIANIINVSPFIMNANATKQEVIHKLKKLHRRHMPLVDEDGVLKSVFTLDDVDFSSKENKVVVMAGGLGSRLGELTKDTPKPMLKVGNRPMLQHLIEQFREQGFCDFIFCVNYKKDIISNYFGSGEKFGVNIKYVIEDKRLGTAGALSLLENGINESFFVVNADILTTLDFDALLTHHLSRNVQATMCVREFIQTLPYGVIKSDESGNLLAIEEKPSNSYDVNSGIYVLDPTVLNYVPSDQFFDMPELFNDLITHKIDCSVYKLSDYWLDIGKIDDFEQANKDIQINNDCD
ncbi:nucleotidyltransferase family protein [Aliivibrio sifiae]